MHTAAPNRREWSKLSLLAFAVMLTAPAWAADYHPLDVKTGTWETTSTNQMSGALALPPDVAAQMTPEQRARAEAILKSRSAQGPKTSVTRSCITKDQLDKALDLAGGQQKNCTRKLLTSTSSKQDIQFECTTAGIKQSGTVHIEAVNSENIKASMQFATGASNMAINMTSKWIGAACTEKDNK